MLDLYQRANATGKITQYKDCFTDAGINTVEGMAERAQIPESWVVIYNCI